MSNLTRRIGGCVLFGLVAWAMSGPQASAQANPYFRMGGMGMMGGGMMGMGTGMNPYAGFPGGGVGFSPFGAASMSSAPLAAAAMSSGYGYGFPGYGYGGGYGGYGNNIFIPDPLSGYLSGSANVINAQGAYMVSAQQSRLIKEQVNREKIENRRRVFEEWLYEREKTPTPADELARFQKIQLGLARLGSDQGSILSGKALNDLLKHLDKVPDNVVPAGQFTLSDDVLNKINVSPPSTNGNVGLLKNEGKLSWPQALMGPDFTDLREKLNSLLPDAIRQATAESKVGNTTYSDISDAVRKTQQLLQQRIKDIPLNQFNDGKRFLSQLEDGVKVLGQTDVGKYFNGDYAAKGQTVPDLIKNMKKNGLTFKPATGADDAAYNALFQALLNYDMATQSQIAAEPKPPEK